MWVQLIGTSNFNRLNACATLAAMGMLLSFLVGENRMTPIHLWLVDDSPTVAAQFAGWAEELGYQLTVMASGQALCQLLHEGHDVLQDHLAKKCEPLRPCL